MGPNLAHNSLLPFSAENLTNYDGAILLGEKSRVTGVMGGHGEGLFRVTAHSTSPLKPLHILSMW